MIKDFKRLQLNHPGPKKNPGPCCVPELPRPPRHWHVWRSVAKWAPDAWSPMGSYGPFTFKATGVWVVYPKIPVFIVISVISSSESPNLSSFVSNAALFHCSATQSRHCFHSRTFSAAKRQTVDWFGGSILIAAILRSHWVIGVKFLYFV